MPQRILKTVIVHPDGERVAGRLHRTAKFVKIGDPGRDDVNTVGNAIIRSGNKVEKVVEKRYFRRYSKPERDLQLLAVFEKAGIPVVPGARLAITKNEKGKLERSLLMDDLTERGKYEVYSMLEANSQKISPMMRGLKNIREISEQMTGTQQAASSLGFALHGDEWLFVVDKRNNTGKVYLADVDNLDLDKKFFEHARVHEFEKAGIKREDYAPSAKAAYRVLRSARDPVSVAGAQLAREFGRFSGVAKVFAKELSNSDSQRFSAMARVYSSMANLAVRLQIGGVSIPRHSIGLNKEQRRKLLEYLSEPPQDSSEKRFRALFTRGEIARRLFPGTDYAPIYAIRRKSRRDQWDAVRIGQRLAALTAYESKRLGKSLFPRNTNTDVQFRALGKTVSSASSKAEALGLLMENKQIIHRKLIAQVYQNLQRDAKMLASYRVRRDMPPYSLSPWEIRRREKFKKENESN